MIVLQLGLNVLELSKAPQNSIGFHFKLKKDMSKEGYSIILSIKYTTLNEDYSDFKEIK
jgi:hypothetical protein